MPIDYQTLPIDLGDGLVLRAVTPADTEELVAFKADVHRAPGAAEPDVYVAAWARDLLEKPHPSFVPDQFLVVEDTRRRRIASSLNLIPQTWTYGGVPFPVGRIECVGTREEYRRLGLVRHQMEVVHAWGARSGHLAQVIVGIPWYYRQFGYEYAAPFGGKRSVPAESVAAVRRIESTISVRPATISDLQFLTSVMSRGATRYGVTCLRDSANWRYEIEGRTIPDSVFIVERAGMPIGAIVLSAIPGPDRTPVVGYELLDGIDWRAVTDGLLRALANRAGSGDPLTFALGEEHPIYSTHPDLAEPGTEPSALYVRVSDLPAFVRRVAPVLESRLAASPLAGHTGHLRLNFFRDGLRLRFEGGSLIEATHFREGRDGSSDALFPPLTFLQVLFGRRSLQEIGHIYPDCQVLDPTARDLIEILFPRIPSLIYPVM